MVVVLTCALVGVCLLRGATALHGPALGHDSAHFVSAADSLLAGEGLLMCSGRPYSLWPPLPAFLLALPRAAGLSPTDAVSVVNAVSLFALLALVGRMGAALASGAGAVAALALLVSPQVYWLFTQGLSEPAFMALTAWGVVELQGYRANPSRGRFLRLVLAVALAALQRYHGVTLIASTALVLAASPLAEPLRTRLRRAASFAVLAALPLAAWMGRNLALGGGATGFNRGEWGTGLGAWWFLRRTWLVVQHWLSPGAAWDAPRILLLALAGVALLVFARHGRAALGRLLRGSGLAPASFLAVFFLVSWFLNAGIDVDGVTRRQIVPFLPFVWVLVAATALTAARASLARPVAGGRVLAAILVGFFALHTADSALDLWRRWPGLRRGTTAYAFNLPFFDDPELWRAARERASAGPALSNDPEATYLHAGLRSLPVGGDRATIRTRVRAFRERGEEGTLIWFRHNDRDQPPLDIFRRNLELTAHAETGRGGVWALTFGSGPGD